MNTPLPSSERLNGTDGVYDFQDTPFPGETRLWTFLKSHIKGGHQNNTVLTLHFIDGTYTAVFGIRFDIIEGIGDLSGPGLSNIRKVSDTPSINTTGEYYYPITPFPGVDGLWRFMENRLHSGFPVDKTIKMHFQDGVYSANFVCDETSLDSTRPGTFKITGFKNIQNVSGTPPTCTPSAVANVLTGTHG